MTVAAVQCVLTPKTGVRVAIVGCGLIGSKRAASLPPGSVTVCCDLAAPRAVQLAAATRGAAPSTDWQATVRRAHVDAVFIAPPPHRRAGPHRLQPPLSPRVPPGARDLRERRAGRNDVYPRPLWPRRTPRLPPRMARRTRCLRRRRTDRPGRTPDRSLPLVPGRFPQRTGPHPHLVLGHAGGRQRVPAARNRRRPGGVPARQLDRVEEPFLLRDRGARGQTRNQRPRRQLRRRAPHLVQNVAGDGTARNPRLGIPHGRRFLARRKHRLPGRHPPGAPTRPRDRRRASHAAHYRDRLSRDARMIITRSPLRISLGGGGTDLPSYYREPGGFVLSAAIDKYVYITLHETFQPEFLIKYSATEVVQTVDEIKHPIIREALRMVPVSAPLQP